MSDRPGFVERHLVSGRYEVRLLGESLEYERVDGDE